MNAVRYTLIAMLTMLPGAVLASETLDIKIVTTMVPVACTPVVEQNGTFNYGTIKASSIDTADYTVLPVKTLGFSIRCDSAAKVALRGVDARAGTLVRPVGKTMNDPAHTVINNSSWMFGLGKSGSSNIGGYRMWIDTPSVKLDGVSAENALMTQAAPTASSTWTVPQLGAALITSPLNIYYSWSLSPTAVPAAFKTMTGTLSVQAAVNKGAALDLRQPVEFDGLATIELYYI